MATTTVVSGAAVKNNSGVALGVTTNTATISGLTIRNSANNHILTEGRPVQSRTSGTQFLLKNTAVVITSITQSASTGLCAVTKSSHGLSVGDKFVVEGADVAGYNTIHTVLVVTSSSVVKTDVPYSADTSTHGSYYTLKGNFATQLKNKYVARRVSTELAGIANTAIFSGGSDHGSPPFAYARGSRRYNITAISLFTGAVTKGGSEGTLNKYHNISANNDNTTVETYPTRAIPGRLTYRTGKANPVSGSYPIIT